MAKKKCPECPKAGAKWMTTFTDLTTLLLTFFVLLLSMASFDVQKVQEFFGVMTGGMGIFDKTSFSQMSDMNIVSRTAMKETVDSTKKKIEENLKELLKSQNLDKMVSVIKTDKGVSIRIMDSVFFTSGSSDLLTTANPILDKIILIIQDTPYNINIEGHTDDTPLGARAFSNWELSTDRAVSVVRYMADKGFNPTRLSASGYGEYHPILPNITAENRAKNRRVEINIVTQEFAETGKNLFEEQ